MEEAISKPLITIALQNKHLPYCKQTRQIFCLDKDQNCETYANIPFGSLKMALLLRMICVFRACTGTVVLSYRYLQYRTVCKIPYDMGKIKAPKTQLSLTHTSITTMAVLHWVSSCDCVIVKPGQTHTSLTILPPKGFSRRIKIRRTKSKEALMTRLLVPVPVLGFVLQAFLTTGTIGAFTPAPLIPVSALYRATNVLSSFRPTPLCSTFGSSSATISAAATAATVADVKVSVAQLKKVLEREYISFFNPMERDYYAATVTFDDPLTQLEGVDGYQKNVDMLAGRTLMGSLLFKDASISLHSVTGGSVTQNRGDVDGSAVVPAVQIEDIMTRWTLRFTFKILPWSPTARFSGISVYTVAAGGPKGVQILKQADYWDSINLLPGKGEVSGAYEAVDKSIALQHFIDQIKPGNFRAVAAGPELPYSTLRLGNGYEVRRYPSFTAVKMVYERRDEAFTAMDSFTSGTFFVSVLWAVCGAQPLCECQESTDNNPRFPSYSHIFLYAGMKPMAPAIIEVNADKSKTMMWPLDFAMPGQETPRVNVAAVKKAAVIDGSTDDQFEIVSVPESVVAVRTFSDAIVEPVVRRVDRELREILQRDGLVAAEAVSAGTDQLTFAQYDAVFSMGQRRSEVHLRLRDGGHPW